ncbi:MAG TPA: arsenite methyltransferase [Candidatus Hydrogenedentes bacterium]|nr:arsenite methyltransferase [Candidatus Hydrogenedentota bacterium]
MSDTDVKEQVKARYGSLARGESASCCGDELAAEATSSCCGSATAAEVISSCCGTAETTQSKMSKSVGYSEEELGSLPEGANLGVGCGNPLAFSAVEEGDTVVDLGSGAGIDCFLAAQRVGDSGKVIGVDMTPDMLAKARANAETGGYTNVEFREGEIEALPIEDNSVDIIISNCVINLSTNKEAVFSEIHRVLKPGGAFFVSDIVLSHPLPESIRSSAAAYSACVAGAMLKDDYIGIPESKGFKDIDIMSEATYPIDILTADPTVSSLKSRLDCVSEEEYEQATTALVSIKLTGKK